MARYFGGGGGGGPSGDTQLLTVPFADLATTAGSNRSALIAARENIGVFQWLNSQTLAPFGAQVVNGPGGGQWQRLSIPQLQWTEQTNWAIDPILGSDIAVGSPGAPLASIREFKSRINGGTFPAAAKNLTLVGSIAESLDLDFKFALGPTFGVFNIIGTGLTTLFSGTIDAVVAIVSSSNTCPEITCAGVGDWSTAGPSGTTLVGKRMRITTAGPRFGLTAWVGARLLPTQCRTSVWTLQDPTAPNLVPTVVTPLVGDTFVVEDLPVLDGFAMQTSNVHPSGVCSVTLADVQIGTVANGQRITYNCPEGIAGGLWFGRSKIYAPVMAGDIHFMGGCFEGNSLQLQVHHFSSSLAMGAGVVVVSGPKTGQAIAMQNGSICQGLGVSVGTDSVLQVNNTNGLGIIAGPSYGIRAINIGAQIVCSNTGRVWGFDNSVSGLELGPGNIFKYGSNPPTILGPTPGVNDVKIASTHFSHAQSQAMGILPAIGAGVTNSSFAAVKFTGFSQALISRTAELRGSAGSAILFGSNFDIRVVNIPVGSSVTWQCPVDGYFLAKATKLRIWWSTTGTVSTIQWRANFAAVSSGDAQNMTTKAFSATNADSLVTTGPTTTEGLIVTDIDITGAALDALDNADALWIKLTNFASTGAPGTIRVYEVALLS